MQWKILSSKEDSMCVRGTRSRKLGENLLGYNKKKIHYVLCL